MSQTLQICRFFHGTPISEHLERYRSNLVKRLIEAHGERPDPSHGGFIGRIAAKLQAEKWDKHREEVEQKVKDRRELLNSEDPKAVEFRVNAWKQASAEYERTYEVWNDDWHSALEQKMALEQKTSQERQSREAEAKVLAAKMSQKVDGQAPSRTGKDRSNDIEI